MLLSTHQIFHQLGAVPADVLHGLEDVDFAVLDDLFDAGVGRAVDADAGPSIASEFVGFPPKKQQQQQQQQQNGNAL